MGYFLKDEDPPHLCPGCVAQIGRAAYARYRAEFQIPQGPGGVTEFDGSMDSVTRTVTIKHGDFPERTYTFEELGFEKTC